MEMKKNFFAYLLVALMFVSIQGEQGRDLTNVSSDLYRQKDPVRVYIASDDSFFDGNAKGYSSEIVTQIKSDIVTQIKIEFGELTFADLIEQAPANTKFENISNKQYVRYALVYNVKLESQGAFSVAPKLTIELKSHEGGVFWTTVITSSAAASQDNNWIEKQTKEIAATILPRIRPQTSELEKKIARLEEKIETLEKKLTDEEVANLSNDSGGLRGEVAKLKREVAGLRVEVDGHKKRLTALEFSPVFKVYANGFTTIPNGQITTVKYDTIVYEVPRNCWNGGDNCYEVPVSGFYHLEAHFIFPAGPAGPGYRFIAIYQNGISLVHNQLNPGAVATANYHNVVSASTEALLERGDKIRVVAHQDSGLPITTDYRGADVFFCGHMFREK